MKISLTIIIFSFVCAASCYAQIDTQALFKSPILTNSEINAPTTTADEGTLIYSSDTKRVYQFDLLIG